MDGGGQARRLGGSAEEILQPTGAVISWFSRLGWLLLYALIVEAYTRLFISAVIAVANMRVHRALMISVSQGLCFAGCAGQDPEACWRAALEGENGATKKEMTVSV